MMLDFEFRLPNFEIGLESFYRLYLHKCFYRFVLDLSFEEFVQELQKTLCVVEIVNKRLHTGLFAPQIINAIFLYWNRPNMGLDSLQRCFEIVLDEGV